MKLLRRLHLYLGCFFAPMLIFFVATGWYQTVNPDRRKGVADSEDWVSRLTRVHVEQYYPDPAVQSYSTKWFTGLVVLMATALLLTVLLGVVLALRTTRPAWRVWLVLVLGLALPMVFLWLGQRR